MTGISRLLLPLLVLGLVLGGCDSGGGTVPENLGENTSIGFVETEATVGEAVGSQTLELVANDPGYKEITLEMSVDQGASSATLGEDVTGLPADTTITFPQSTTSGGTQSITFDVVDDQTFLEGTETLVVTLSATDATDASVDEGTFTLRIEENDQAYTAQEARQQPAGSRVVAEATVTRVTPDGAYLQDETGGLFVFDSDFAGTVSRGDRVRVDGSTAYFSGLFQVTDVSGSEHTEVLSSGNDLPAPQSVSLTEIASNGEAYESELVRVVDFGIDAGGDQTFQAGSNYTAVADTSLTLRIPDGSELVGESIPDRANFVGVLGQFNAGFGGADEPDEGYQMLGIRAGDLQTVERLLAVDFSDDILAPMTAVSVASNEDWEVSSEGDPPNAPYGAANGFGADEASNDWLISPAMDLTAYEGEALTFLNAKGFDDSGRRGLQVKVSTDYDGSGNPENFTWTDVSDQVNFSEGDFNFVNSGTVDLSGAEFDAAEVYVAFQYQSTGPFDAAAWQVDNIVVRGLPGN